MSDARTSELCAAETHSTQLWPTRSAAGSRIARPTRPPTGSRSAGCVRGGWRAERGARWCSAVPRLRCGIAQRGFHAHPSRMPEGGMRRVRRGKCHSRLIEAVAPCAPPRLPVATCRPYPPSPPPTRMHAYASRACDTPADSTVSLAGAEAPRRPTMSARHVARPRHLLNVPRSLRGREPRRRW